MFEKMLVPLDCSGLAEMSLPYSVEIAAVAGSQVTLVTVSETPAEDTSRLYQSYLQRVQTQMLGQLKAWGAKGEPTVGTEVFGGRPAEKLLQYSEQNDVGLIVMASRGRSGHGPWPLGNIAAKIVRAAHVPVLLIRRPAGEAALQKQRLIRRILLPLDGSRLGEAALPYAEHLGILLNAELVLINVIQPDPVPIPYEGYMVIPEPKDPEEQRKRYAEEYLGGVAKGLQTRGASVSTVAIAGLAADKITEYSESNRIDLVAMSTHGRSGIGRWVFGSVTDKVLHAGEVPTLVVRPR